MDKTKVQQKIPLIKTLRILLVILWFVYSIAVLANKDKIYNVFSPLTALTASVITLASLKKLGSLKPCGITFALGFFFWFISDVLLFSYTYIAVDNPFLMALTDKMYLLPDYMFFTVVVLYAKTGLAKTDFYRLLIDTFMLTYVSFAFVITALKVDPNPKSGVNFEILSTMFYFFAILFATIMMILLIVQTGLRNKSKQYHIIAIFFTIYNIFEARYSYYVTQSKDAESIYIDIIYLGSIMIYALCISNANVNINIKDNFHKLKIRYDIKSANKFIWINVFIISAISIVLYSLSYISSSELYSMLIISLAYVVAHKSLESGELYSKLLETQKTENARLEKIVAEKTRELRDINKYLEKIATIDSLTGLFNRHYFTMFIKELIEKDNSVKLAFFSLDLNFFKPINDKFGHDMGDFVLREIGKRLMSVSPENCTAFRMGGDEFMIVFIFNKNSDDDFLSSVNSIACSICEKTDSPVINYDDDGNPHLTFRLSSSIGIALYPQQSMSVDELLKFSDIAMYDVKHKFEKSAFKIYDQRSA